MTKKHTTLHFAAAKTFVMLEYMILMAESNDGEVIEEDSEQFQLLSSKLTELLQVLMEVSREDRLSIYISLNQVAINLLVSERVAMAVQAVNLMHQMSSTLIHREDNRLVVVRQAFEEVVSGQLGGAA